MGAAAHAADAGQAVDVGRVSVVLPAGPWHVGEESPVSGAVTSSISSVPGSERSFTLAGEAEGPGYAKLTVTAMRGLANVAVHGECRPEADFYVRDFNRGAVSTVVPYRCLRISGPLPGSDPRFASIVARLRAGHRPLPPAFYLIDARLTNRSGAEVAIVGLFSDDFTGLPGVEPDVRTYRPGPMPAPVAAWGDRIAEQADDALTSLFPKLRIPSIEFKRPETAPGRPASS
jgi:hypothetical protein